MSVTLHVLLKLNLCLQIVSFLFTIVESYDMTMRTEHSTKFENLGAGQEWEFVFQQNVYISTRQTECDEHGHRSFHCLNLSSLNWHGYGRYLK